MKHLILTLLLLLCSCSNEPYQSQNPKNPSLLNMKIVEIDSCEYIQYHVYAYEAITHKGNCKYCTQRNKK